MMLTLGIFPGAITMLFFPISGLIATFKTCTFASCKLHQLHQLVQHIRSEYSSIILEITTTAYSINITYATYGMNITTAAYSMNLTTASYIA